MADIFYHAVPVDWTREQKLRYLAKTGTLGEVAWTDIAPNKKHQWLTGDLRAEFETFLSMGTKGGKSAGSETVFRSHSMGMSTNRDAWVVNFSPERLAENIERTIESYNDHVERWQKLKKKPHVDSFADHDDTKVSWSSSLKTHLTRERRAQFSREKLRPYLYRPFSKASVYFDDILVHRICGFPELFPTADSENRIVCVTDCASEKPFLALMTDSIADLHVAGAGSGTQCFPFYTYDGEDGSRRENIPLSTLVRFQNHYGDEAITKWDIFHYVYAVLHHPEYRTRYAANLRRELPRIPFVVEAALSAGRAASGIPHSDAIEKKTARAQAARRQSATEPPLQRSATFHAYAAIGKQLAEIHVGYESAPEHPLQRVESPDEPLNWRVEKMRLTKDKTAINYNGFLTLAGIPPEAFVYRLGNRSALEWVIDQYQVHTDPRSGITNDPNREDEPDYIVKLIGKVITVSLKTQSLIASLPPLAADNPV